MREHLAFVEAMQFIGFAKPMSCVHFHLMEPSITVEGDMKKTKKDKAPKPGKNGKC